MFRKIFQLLIAVIFIMGISSLLYAMSCHNMDSGSSQHQQMAQAGSADQTAGAAGSTVQKEAVNVGNKICPVLGEEINEKTKSTVEYEGKIYNLCCSGCINVFKSDPQKYIKKIEEEKLAVSK